MTPAELILGPHVKAGTDPRAAWFDKTMLERGKAHGEAFPAVPPTGDAFNQYELDHYYDLGLAMDIIHARTGDPAFKTLFETVTDSWWKSLRIDEGRVRNFMDGGGPAPRHSGLGSLMLRAASRPEMWDWIKEYIRAQLQRWILLRLNNAGLWYGPREGAFTLQGAAWLSVAMPDSYPIAGGTATDGAAVRAEMRESVAKAVEYYRVRQSPDGSWRSTEDYRLEDGGTLLQTMQPFMVGLLMQSLADTHRAHPDEAVRASALAQISKAAHHLYDGGPYRKGEVAGMPGVRWRAFFYVYHGGTTVNPTRFENGVGLPWSAETGSDWGWSTVKQERQGISLILPTYGYLYAVTKDPWFKTAGDDLWDAAYGETDGQRSLMDARAKEFNQHMRGAPKYLAWTSGETTPAPPPPPVVVTPTPTPEPPPPAPPKAAKVVIYDSTGVAVTRVVLPRKGVAPLTAKVFDQYGKEFTAPVLWSSSQSSIATVASTTGRVTAKAKPGVAYVYCSLATDSSLKSDRVAVEVK
jgi:hypothetical protein